MNHDVPRSSRARSMVCALTGALALGLLACQPTGGTSVPAKGAGPPARETLDQPAQGPHESDNLGDLRLRLERLRTEQDAVMQSASPDDSKACERLCALASSICSVQRKLCDLADEHPSDGEYQKWCREARLECRDAQQSCLSCVERHSQ